MTPLSHSQARLWIEQAADGILNLEQQGVLDAHLKGCAECRAFAAELAALESSLSESLKAHWPASGLPSPQKKELVKEMQGQFAKGGGAAAAASTPILKWLLAFGLLLAAALLLWFLFAQGSTPEAPPEPSLTASRTSTATATATLEDLAAVTKTPSELVLIAIPSQNANCREGNASVFEIADTLFEGKEYTPDARGRDNLWVRFRGPVNETLCWVFIDNLDLFINREPVEIVAVPESLLPFAPYPSTPTPSPTPTFTPEPFRPECSDGLDNDSDGRVDLADTACRNGNDNDEAVP